MSFTITPRRAFSGLAVVTLLSSVLTVIPAHAAPENTITGTVTNTAYVPSTGIDVWVMQADGGLVADTVTNGSGQYTFGGLPDGSYKIEFENQTEAAREWYDNKPNFETATVINVSGGETYTANAHLTMAGENITRPSISGTATVGSTLVGDRGTWFPNPLGGFSYQWLRNGSEIAGATALSYTVTDADRGARLSLQVKALGGGSYEQATSAPTDQVPGAPAQTAITSMIPPTISGTTTVGSTLLATAGTWQPQATSVSYQWLANGSALSGATGSSLVLSDAHAGKTISVRVTAAATGYTAASATSAPTSPVAAPIATIENILPPHISGMARVGSTLRTDRGFWSGEVTSYGYQWLRDGRAITGARSATYRLAPADAGKRISVRVTATAGRASASASAAGTSRIAKATAKLNVKTKGTKRKARIQITVTSAGAKTGKATIQLRGQGQKIKRTVTVRNGKATVTIKKLKKGNKKVTVSYRGDASTQAVKKTARVRVR